MRKPLSQYEKVTEAVLHPRYGQGRTRELLNRTPTKIRNLIHQSDRLLGEIEELNLKQITEMSDDLRVRLFHFILQCDLEPEVLVKLEGPNGIRLPILAAVGQNWVFKAQERLFGIVTDEVYQLEEQTSTQS